MYSALFLLIVGFVLLIKGAFFLVQGASSIAKTYNISPAIIGLTVVAFGTSTPELFVSMYAVFDGRDELAFANAIGSNIFNVLFVLGVSGIIFPILVQRSTIRIEIPLSLLAATMLYFLVNDQILGNGLDRLARGDALVLLIVFSGFLVFMFRALKTIGDYEETSVKVESTPVATGSIILGIALLIGGASLVVDYAVILATYYLLPQRFIGLTFLAVGTSVPELTTAVVAAYRKNTDIAIGNVIGSNIFNILFAIGVTGLVHPMDYSSALNEDIEILGFSTILLIVFMFTINQRKLDRWEAFILLMGYVAYIIYRVMHDLP